MRNIKFDISYIGILLVAFTLPFSLLTNNIAIIIGLLPILFAIAFDKQSRILLITNIGKNKIALLFLAFALLYIISGFIHWSEYDNLSILYHDIEKRAVFIVFPIIMAIVPMLSDQQNKKVFYSFFFGIIMSSVILFSIAAYLTTEVDSINFISPRHGIIENNFMYHRLGSYLDLHAVYYSCMVLMAFILVMAFTKIRFIKSNEQYRVLLIITLLYLLVLLFLLKSAVILIGLMLIIGSYGAYHLFKARYKLGTGRMVFLVSLSIVLMTAFGFRVLDKIGDRGNFLSYNFTEPGGGQWNVVNLRIAKWDITLRAISEHWLSGIGPGNIHPILDSYYNKYNFKVALIEHYNPHNQFLDTFLTLGVIGFFIILSIYAFSFYYSFKRTDLVWFLFMVGFTFFSMSESTLAVNKGIIFFTFFTCYFSYLPRSTSTYFR